MSYAWPLQQRDATHLEHLQVLSKMREILKDQLIATCEADSAAVKALLSATEKMMEYSPTSPAGPQTVTKDQAQMHFFTSALGRGQAPELPDTGGEAGGPNGEDSPSECRDSRP